MKSQELSVLQRRLAALLRSWNAAGRSVGPRHDTESLAPPSSRGVLRSSEVEILTAIARPSSAGEDDAVDHPRPDLVREVLRARSTASWRHYMRCSASTEQRVRRIDLVARALDTLPSVRAAAPRAVRPLEADHPAGRLNPPPPLASRSIQEYVAASPWAMGPFFVGPGQREDTRARAPCVFSCPVSACARRFATAAEVLRHVDGDHPREGARAPRVKS